VRGIKIVPLITLNNNNMNYIIGGTTDDCSSHMYLYRFIIHPVFNWMVL